MPATPDRLSQIISRFNSFIKKGHDSRMRSIEVQFRHMAQGGNGDAACEGEIRATYYPEWSTKDFQTVCDVFGWDYRGEKLRKAF
tara:strand:+ start:1263 stop:1517 length:255 start_codon:yes stop_codon:yes gene_type:complete